MTAVETFGGTLLLLLALAFLIAAYHKHMQSIYADIANEEAEKLADDKFEDMKQNMQIRVKQQLVVVDEMGEH